MRINGLIDRVAELAEDFVRVLPPYGVMGGMIDASAKDVYHYLRWRVSMKSHLRLAKRPLNQGRLVVGFAT